MFRRHDLVAIAVVAFGVLAITAGCGVSQTSTTLSPDTAFYGSSVYVSPPDGQSTLAVAKIDEIKRVSGVSTAFTVYRFDATSGAVELSGAASTDSIVASDPSEAAWSGLKTQYAQGHAIEADSSSEVVLGGVIAKELSKSVGDAIDLPLHPTGGTASHAFNVVGILELTGTGPDRFAYVNITDGQMLLKDNLPAGQRDLVDVTTVATGIDVYAKAGTSIAQLDKIADQINKQVSGAKAVRPSRLLASIKR